MKKILLITFTFQLFLFLTSCTDINSTDKTKIKKNNLLDKLSSKYEYVGQKHNEGLNSIINGFSNAESIESKKEAFNLVEKFGAQYLEDQSVENPEFKFAKKTFKENAKLYSESFIKSSRNGTRNKYNRSLKASRNISNQQKYFVNEIKKSLAESKSIENFKDDLDKIEKSASQNLSEKELELIIISTTVARSSASYWNKNAEKWERVIAKKIKNSNKVNTQDFDVIANGPEEPEEFDISWESLASTDVVSATVSAGVTLITGCEFYTLGACTAAAGIGGGILGSAADGLSQLVGETYDYFFNFRLSPINDPLKRNNRNLIPQSKDLDKPGSSILKSKFQS